MKVYSDINNDYCAVFDTSNGRSLRWGQNNSDPFWKCNGPELLDISITNYCERECDFCYRNSNLYGKFMDVGFYKNIVAEAQHLGVFQIALGGGNPNQHPDFIKFLKITREHEIIPSYTTNGQGMNDNIYKASKEFAGAIAVSWYYPYKDAETVIKKCNEYDIPVNIHFVLQNDNIFEAEKLLNNYRIIENVNAVVFLNYKPVGKILKRPLAYSKRLTKFLSSTLAIEKCQIGFDSCMICHLVDFKDCIDERSFDFCEAGRFSAFISEEGEMYPCSFMCGAGAKGYNLQQNSMEYIWKNAPSFILQRKKLSSTSEECEGCKAWDLCHSGCPAFDINRCKNKEGANDS